MRAGVYVVVLVLPASRTIRVGRLGRFRFEGGRYAYVGSAQRGLAKRLARHGRRCKPARWHVDYLSRHCRLEAAYTWPLPKAGECRVAEALRQMAGVEPVVQGFGASDCRCAGHLFRIPQGVCPGDVLEKRFGEGRTRRGSAT